MLCGNHTQPCLLQAALRQLSSARSGRARARIEMLSQEPATCMLMYLLFKARAERNFAGGRGVGGAGAAAMAPAAVLRVSAPDSTQHAAVSAVAYRAAAQGRGPHVRLPRTPRLQPGRRCSPRRMALYNHKETRRARHDPRARSHTGHTTRVLRRRQHRSQVTAPQRGAGDVYWHAD